LDAGALGGFSTAAGIKLWRLTGQFRRHTRSNPSTPAQDRKTLERFWAKDQQTV
jgi:hypothetical protein